MSLARMNSSAEGIRRLIENKSFAALGDALEPFKGKPAAKALSAMPNLFGGIEVLDEVEALTGNVRVLGATAYLRRLYKALDEAGYGDRIMIDLGLVHEMDYYTGIMFRGYIGGAGAAILAGGRYNALCAKFGKDMPAGGFGIDVESVADSLAGASRPEVATRRDTVRIALTKGRLEKKTLALLKAAGYDISELEAGTRKLIFTLPDSGVEIVLSKAADVITYVEHGVCDMGVVGKDTIMEKGGSFYEMVDLGFGKCRFALATKKGKDVYGGDNTPVIATKYPAVTKAFFNKKNMDAETIKIEGSVELAPLLELADGIVDIVETGTTLKENGLEVVENVSAHLGKSYRQSRQRQDEEGGDSEGYCRTGKRLGEVSQYIYNIIISIGRGALRNIYTNASGRKRLTQKGNTTMFMKTVLADGQAEQQVIREMKARAAGARGDIEQIVRGVMADVQARGWEAVVEYAEKFDGKAPYIVEPEVLDDATTPATRS